MIRYQYSEIRRQFIENSERVLLYGPPYVGKSYMLRCLTEEESVKDYILVDLRIDRDFTEGLKNALAENLSLCDFACEYYSMNYEYVRNTLNLFLDGLEPLGEYAQDMIRRALPIHFAATTSRIDAFSNLMLQHDYGMIIRPYRIHSFSFYEFLDAITEGSEISYTEILKTHFLSDMKIPDVLDDETRELFHDYLMVGGYPEAIRQYCKNRTDISEIRMLHEKIFAGTVLRYTENVLKGISTAKIMQLFQYIGLYAHDNRGAFHPGHFRRGAMVRHYLPEIKYLTENQILLSVYHEESFYRFEISDCGLLRYLANDYDMFYITDNRETLPEYFYQNYFYHVLAERNRPIHVKKSGRSDFSAYTNGINSFRLFGSGRPLYDVLTDDTAFYLTNRKNAQKNLYHNIQYYFLEQTQF